MIEKDGTKKHVLEFEGNVVDEDKIKDFISRKRRLDVFGNINNFSDVLDFKEPVVIRVRHENGTSETKFRDFGRRFNGIENPEEDESDHTVLNELMPTGHLVEGFWVNFVDLMSTNRAVGMLQYFVGREETNEGDDWIVIAKKEGEVVRKYYLPEWDHQSLYKMVMDLNNGSLKPQYRSQKIAAEEKLPVKGLTSDTLESEIIQKSGNALVIGYSPTCGFCVEGREIMQKLASEYEGTPGFGVYEIDLVENEHASYHVESFPKVLFYSEEDKMDPEYLEAKSYKQLKGFLVSKGIKPVKPVVGDEL